MSDFCNHFHFQFGSLIYQLYQNRNIFSPEMKRVNNRQDTYFSKNKRFHFLDTELQFPICFLVNVISF